MHQPDYVRDDGPVTHQPRRADDRITLRRARAVVIDLLDRAIREVEVRDAEIARLKAELDGKTGRNVVHFYEEKQEAWRLAYLDEPDGTIARATDTGREWVKIAGYWEEQT
ncbi:MAG TPA: hypothetical protein VGI66_17560 [Streptosporangiaceae bacterium]|jgi:hypothetical protein